jgi:hypothetical protein
MREAKNETRRDNGEYALADGQTLTSLQLAFHSGDDLRTAVRKRPRVGAAGLIKVRSTLTRGRRRSWSERGRRAPARTSKNRAAPRDMRAAKRAHAVKRAKSSKTLTTMAVEREALNRAPRRAHAGV